MYLLQQFLKKVTIPTAKPPEASTVPPMTGSSPRKQSDLNEDTFSDEERPEQEGDEDDGSAQSPTAGTRKRGKKKKQIVIHGYQLAALFRKRPELAEFVYLEIANMKNDPTNKQTAVDIH
jgi:hypothetical protein